MRSGLFDGTRRIFFAQRARQGARYALAADRPRSRIVGDALSRQIAEKTAHRSKRTLHAARAQTFRPPSGDEGADIGGGELRQGARIDATAQMLLLKVEEPRQIVAIGAQRVRARALFMRQRVQPGRFQSFGGLPHDLTARSTASSFAFSAAFSR